MQFLDALIGKQHFLDAVRFLAHALPKREAVWWACVCARQVADGKEPAPVKAALAAAEKWVADPSEDNRATAMPAARRPSWATPAGCAAMAAFWSGGSLAPPKAPVVPPARLPHRATASLASSCSAQCAASRKRHPRSTEIPGRRTGRRPRHQSLEMSLGACHGNARRTTHATCTSARW